jgi:hypothetical protein
MVLVFVEEIAKTRVSQIGPANYALNESVLGCEAEERPRFVDGLLGYDRDRAVKAIALEDGLQVRGGIARREVLVGVEAQLKNET